MKKKKGLGGRILLVVVLVLTMIVTMVPFTVSASADTTKLIAFTFDDGPSNNTVTLLNGLKSRGVPATFFMCAKNGSHGIDTHKSLLTRMVQEGHQLANHSYNHPSIGSLSGGAVASQFGQVETRLFEAMGGSYMDFVRTPGGALSTTIRNNCGAPIILWSVDTLDWKTRNADSVYNEIIKSSKDGSIVLMHDLYATSVTGALRAIDTLKKQGYEFVTVAELMRRKGVTPSNGKSYTNCYGQTLLPAYSAPMVTGTTDHNTMSTTITMSSVDSGVTLYYTTDGSYPTLSSNKYTGPFKLTQDSSFTVVGYDKYGTRTPLATNSFKKYTVAMPTAAETSDGKISMKSETTAASIYYTTDGSDPVSNGKLYTGPIEVEKGSLKIVAIQGQVEPSEINNYQVAGGKLFTDLDAGSWYFEGVSNTVKAGWMKGNGEMAFDPNGTLSRAMMMQILYNVEGCPAVAADQPTAAFEDVKDTDWFAKAVKWAYANGISVGYSDTWFGAYDEVTREQMVTLLYRYTDKYKGYDVSGTADLSSFSDGNKVGDFAKAAFEWAISRGFISGTDAGTLEPQAPATRATAAVILTRYMALEFLPKPVDGDKDDSDKSDRDDSNVDLDDPAKDKIDDGNNPIPVDPPVEKVI